MCVKVSGMASADTLSAISHWPSSETVKRSAHATEVGHAPRMQHTRDNQTGRKSWVRNVADMVQAVPSES